MAKKSTALALGFVLMAINAATAQYNSNSHRVNPYTRNDGTYVQGHQRTNPDNNPYNNYGRQQDTNPYNNRSTDYDAMGNSKSGRNPHSLF